MQYSKPIRQKRVYITLVIHYSSNTLYCRRYTVCDSKAIQIDFLCNINIIMITNCRRTKIYFNVLSVFIMIRSNDKIQTIKYIFMYLWIKIHLQDTINKKQKKIFSF